MIDLLNSPLFAGIACGLVTWGALRVEMKWLRRDVDDLKDRANAIDARCIAEIRAAARGERPL